MKVLEKPVLRFLISLAIVAVITQVFRFFTGGDLTRSPLTFVALFVVYMILTFVYAAMKRKEYQEMDRTKDDVLDQN